MSVNAVNNFTPAMETLLNTTELLEHIISFVPMP
jgi:hypothetical protein